MSEKIIIMKKLPLRLMPAFFIAASFRAEAQQISYGAEGGLNHSTQLFYDPQKPADGTTQLNAASGFHAGINATATGLFHNKVLDFFTYKTRLAYARRGSVQPAQFSEMIIPAGPSGIAQYVPLTNTNIKSTLDYLCLDVILQKNLFRFGQRSSFFLNGGLGNNLLLASDIKASEIIGTSYPYDQYNNRSLNRYNLTWIVGLGINVENKFSLFIESNKAFTPVYRSANLRVKDWSWTLGASINIGSFHIHSSKATAQTQTNNASVQ